MTCRETRCRLRMVQKNRRASWPLHQKSRLHISDVHKRTRRTRNHASHAALHPQLTSRCIKKRDSNSPSTPARPSTPTTHSIKRSSSTAIARIDGRSLSSTGSIASRCLTGFETVDVVLVMVVVLLELSIDGLGRSQIEHFAIIFGLG